MKRKLGSVSEVSLCHNAIAGYIGFLTFLLYMSWYTVSQIITLRQGSFSIHSGLSDDGNDIWLLSLQLK